MTLPKGIFFWTLRGCFFTALLYSCAIGTDKAFVNNYLGIYELGLWLCTPLYILLVCMVSYQYATLDSKKEKYIAKYRETMGTFENGYEFTKTWIYGILYKLIFKCIYGPATVIMAGIFLGDYSLFFVTLFVYVASLVYSSCIIEGFRLLHRLENKDNPKYDAKKDEVVEESTKDPEQNLRFQSLEIS